MNSETVVYCVVALILGMLLANMLKSVCGCKVVEGGTGYCDQGECPDGYVEVGMFNSWASDSDSMGPTLAELDESANASLGGGFCKKAEEVDWCHGWISKF